MQREIVLDTETTGIDPAGGHRIVEIGCVELLGGMRSGEFFHAYLNPERDMPHEAERVHGLSAEFLSDKPLFTQKVGELLDFLSDSALVIHNAAFDMKFLNAELKVAGFKVLPMSRAIDTLLMARKKFPGSPANLDALCKRFDIDLSARTKHGALLDAELLSDVYIELLGGKQSTLTFDAGAKTGVVQAETVSKNKLETRAFPAKQEEQEAHAKMLEKLKDPLWASE